MSQMGGNRCRGIVVKENKARVGRRNGCGDVMDSLIVKELFLFFYKCIDERNTLLRRRGIGT